MFKRAKIILYSILYNDKYLRFLVTHRKLWEFKKNKVIQLRIYRKHRTKFETINIIYT